MKFFQKLLIWLNIQCKHVASTRHVYTGKYQNTGLQQSPLYRAQYGHAPGSRVSRQYEVEQTRTCKKCNEVLSVEKVWVNTRGHKGSCYPNKLNA